MINVIGFKRSGFLFIFLMLNAAMFALLYFYIFPEAEASSRRVSQMRGEVSTLQGDIDKIQIEFEQMGDQQRFYDELKQKGFFKSQTRDEAKQLFKVIQSQSGVISAVASIKSGQAEENAEAEKAKHIVLASKINIDIEAFDDTDVYKYLMLAKNNFPGHLSLDEIGIERVLDVTPVLLREISSGKAPSVIKARVVMTWRTMIPEDQVIPKEGVN